MWEHRTFRQWASLSLVLCGAALLVYGVFVHAAVISSAEESDAVATAQREPALIREVAIGGLERDDSGEIKKTYAGQAPKACPT